MGAVILQCRHVLFPYSSFPFFFSTVKLSTREEYNRDDCNRRNRHVQRYRRRGWLTKKNGIKETLYFSSFPLPSLKVPNPKKIRIHVEFRRRIKLKSGRVEFWITEDIWDNLKQRG